MSAASVALKAFLQQVVHIRRWLRTESVGGLGDVDQPRRAPRGQRKLV